MKELLTCECSSSEHIIILSVDEQDINDKKLYINIHLSKLSFKQRFIKGIKYIFGYSSKYGDFDEIILNKSDKSKLLEIINKL